jgi:hypothetical protein
MIIGFGGQKWFRKGVIYLSGLEGECNPGGRIEESVRAI